MTSCSGRPSREMLWEISGFTCLQDAEKQARKERRHSDNAQLAEEKDAAKQHERAKEIARYAMNNVAAMLPELRTTIRDRSTKTETEEFKQMPPLKRANLNNAIMRLDAIKSVAEDCLSSKSKDVEFSKDTVKEAVKIAEAFLKGRCHR